MTIPAVIAQVLVTRLDQRITRTPAVGGAVSYQIKAIDRSPNVGDSFADVQPSHHRRSCRLEFSGRRCRRPGRAGVADWPWRSTGPFRSPRSGL